MFFRKELHSILTTEKLGVLTSILRGMEEKVLGIILEGDVAFLHVKAVCSGCRVGMANARSHTVGVSFVRLPSPSLARRGRGGD